MKISSVVAASCFICLLSRNALAEEEICKCYEWPFEPVPPCLKVCVPEAAANASADFLIDIGVDQALAEKVVSLNNESSLYNYTQFVGADAFDSLGMKIGSIEGLAQSEEKWKILIDGSDMAFSDNDTVYLPVNYSNISSDRVTFFGTAEELSKTEQPTESMFEGMEIITNDSVEVLGGLGLVGATNLLTSDEVEILVNAFSSLTEQEVRDLLPKKQ